jgi:hypothetical protein
MHIFRNLSHRIGLCALVSTAAIALVSTASAQPLSKRLPGGAVLYFESSGGDAVADQEKDTPFGKLLAEPSVSRLFDEASRAFTILLRKQAAEQDEAAAADAVLDILSTLWHRPVALDVLGVAMTETGPMPEAVLAVDFDGSDENANRFMKSLESLIETKGMLPPPIASEIEGRAFKQYTLPFVPPIRYGVVDGMFVITVSDSMTKKVIDSLGGKGATVSADAGLVAAMRKIGTDGRTAWMMGHLDAESLQKQAREVWTMMAQSETFPPMIENALKATGLDRLRSATFAHQIGDGGYRHSMYVALPAEDGRPKWMHQAPVTDAQLRMVPQDATLAKVANFRLTDVYDGVMHVVDAIGPMAQGPVKNGLAQAEGAIGLRIREDILNLFDDGLVAYISPSSGGLIITGLTMMIETKDPEGVEGLGKRLIAALEKNLPPGAFTIEQYDYKGHTIDYVSVAGPPVPVAPAWAFHDKYLVVGLYPQSVTHAIDHLTAGPGAKSILDNPDFIRGRKLLPKNMSTIAYADTKATMGMLYRLLLPLGTGGIAAARGEGIELKPDMIPTYDTFVRHFYGDVGGVSSDDDGFLVTYHGPLPVEMGAVTVPFMVALQSSILLPSLSRARELAKRQVSVANVRGILVACQLYAGDHDGDYPPDLDMLVGSEDLPKKMLHSPRDDGNGRSYIYVKGFTTSEPNLANKIVIYERPDIGNGEGSAVGFGDGRAEWVERDALRSMLKDPAHKPAGAKE